MKRVALARETAACSCRYGGAWLIGEMLVSRRWRGSGHEDCIARVLVILVLMATLIVDHRCSQCAVFLRDATKAIFTAAMRLVICIMMVIRHSTISMLMLKVRCLEAARACTVIILLKLLLLSLSLLVW